MSNCNHCGAKKWNILGDAETGSSNICIVVTSFLLCIFFIEGYVLTEDGNKNCIKRVGDLATFIKCDKGYSTVQLQC